MDATIPLSPGPAAVHETHCGVVFLFGDRAYKLKKPVDLGFLDFTTREARERVCHREVELNRRLSPDVYLGVADITGPGGEACDHAVVMRRMPEHARLSALVDRGEDVTGVVVRLAAMLATFHAGADRGRAISSSGTRDALLGRWEASFAQVGPFAGPVLDPVDLAETTAATRSYLAGRADLFADRIARGRVVDGHGDLLADDIFCLPDGPRVLDCLEFDDALRHVDVLDDVAFLAMDLERLGTPALGDLLLDTYAQLTDDPAPRSLRHHYLAYRAFVRAKVACLRHGQGDPSAQAVAREHAGLALRHLRAGEVRLILTGGLPGSGKSTVAAGLERRLGATVVSSDLVRKELAGLAPLSRAGADFGQGLYDGAHTEETYRELLCRAERALRLGETVVLDASWISADHRRAAAEVAARTSTALVQLRCEAPESVTSARITRRRGSASDATPAVARRMATAADPWPGAHTVLTAGPVEGALVQALSILDGEARARRAPADTGIARRVNPVIARGLD